MSMRPAQLASYLIGTDRRLNRLEGHQLMISNQRPFLFTVGFVCILTLITSPQIYGHILFLTGIFLALFSALPALVVPAGRFSRTLFWTIPLLQFGAIAGLRAGGDGHMVGLSLIAAFPIIWMAWFEPNLVRVHVINFAATMFIANLPMFVNGRVPSLQEMGASFVIPVILTVIGLFAANVSQSVEAQQEELMEKDRQLREAAAESRRRAQLLDTVIETVPVGVVVVDADGHDLMMNSHQRGIHQLGIPPEVPDPREDQLMILDEDKTTSLPADERPVRRAINGASFSGQLIWIGDQRYHQAFSVSANAMQDPEGSPAGSIIVFNNVTELVEALEVKDEFLQAMSHELRTPLTSILGYIDLALEKVEDLPDTEAICAHLQVAERNASRMLHLVTDLLTTASRPSLNFREADLAEVVRSSIASAQLQAEAADVVIIDAADAYCPGRFDPDRMHQVVDNLISNAIKYSPPGASVTAEVWKEDKFLHMRITDTGRGISQEDQREIFDKFFRAEEARDSAVPGVGLGLNITKRLVEAHHGSISVSSEPERGSAFTVTIPSQ